MDTKTETIFFTTITFVIAILALIVSYEFGVKGMQKEAIERNFAHYDVRSNGDTEFRWNNPAQ